MVDNMQEVQDIFKQKGRNFHNPLKDSCSMQILFAVNYMNSVSSCMNYT